MSTKQIISSLGSIVILALLASPCAAQIFYVRDPSGYVRPVVIPQPFTFSMGMQVQPIVSPDRMFVRLNVTPIGGAMIDPAALFPVLVPGPNLGVFDGGRRQPSFISLKPNVVVLGLQGQQGLFGQANFAGQTASQIGPFGPFQSSSFSLMSGQSISLVPSAGIFGPLDIAGLTGSTMDPLNAFQSDPFALTATSVWTGPGGFDFSGQMMPPLNSFGQFPSNPLASMWQQSAAQFGAPPVVNPNMANRLQPNGLNPMYYGRPITPVWPRSRIR